MPRSPGFKGEAHQPTGLRGRAPLAEFGSLGRLTAASVPNELHDGLGELDAGISRPFTRACGSIHAGNRRLHARHGAIHVVDSAGHIAVCEADNDRQAGSVSESLASLAETARSALKKTKQSRATWLAATLQLAEALRQAREALPSNDVFGAWLADNKLDVSKDDKSALINLAVHKAEALEVFERPEWWSARLAWNELRRLRTLRTREAVESIASEVAEPENNVVEFVPRTDDDADELTPLPLSFRRTEFPTNFPTVVIEAISSLICARRF